MNTIMNVRIPQKSEKCTEKLHDYQFLENGSSSRRAWRISGIYRLIALLLKYKAQNIVMVQSDSSANHAVEQLVDELCYKPDSRAFES
jgi:hypothetical protein